MSEEGEPVEERGRGVVLAASQFAGPGIGFAMSVAFFGWVGFKVGTRIGAQTLLLLLGMLFGGAAGFYNLYIQVVIRPREERGREESDED